MLTRLRLTNFKAWQDSGDITLKPVTLLLGANSTGKSSILQSLLLLKQTANSPDRRVHLNLGGHDANDLVDMGTFDNVLFEEASERKIGIELDVNDYVQKLKLDYPSYLSVEYVADAMKSAVTHQLKLSDDKQNWYRTQRSDSTNFSVYAPFERTARLKGAECSPERSVAFSAEAIAALELGGGVVQDISLRLQRKLKRIEYLGPLRSRPQRSYTWNRIRPGIIGDDGSKAVDALLASANQSASIKGQEKEDLIEKVSYWLKRMQIADKLEVRGRGGSYEVLIHRDGVAANLRDVGIGVSQVLPVLVLAYFAPEYSTIILEEPEIHLHPQAQALLAELFLEVSEERNVQFLVETHSEHLFRRLQTHVAEQTADRDKCALYFVERSGAEAKLKDLVMDQYGRVSDWPANFFGDVTGEVRSQTKAAMKRIKQERQQG